jgi:hypothetical protein
MPTTRSGLSFDPTAFYQVPIEFDPPNLDGPTTPHIQAIDPNGYVSPIYDPTRHLTRSFLRHRITTLIVTGSRSMGSRSMPPSCSRRLLRRIFDTESLPERPSLRTQRPRRTQNLYPRLLQTPARSPGSILSSQPKSRPSHDSTVH